MDAPEPNPGRLAKREEQRRQRRSVFMTALIGSTVTAVLAAAAAFRIHDTSTGNGVRIVTTTTTLAPPATTAPDDNTTVPTLFVPTSQAPGTPAPTTAAAPTSTSTSTTSTTTVAAPPPPRPTPPTQPGQANVVWNLSPSTVTVQSGAQTSVTLTATNHGTAAGIVVVPGCPASPHSYSVVRGPGAQHFGNACHSGAQMLTIAPGQSYRWVDTVSATTDATRLGSALPPGNYVVLVNSAPSPVMFLKMTVTP